MAGTSVPEYVIRYFASFISSLILGLGFGFIIWAIKRNRSEIDFTIPQTFFSYKLFNVFAMVVVYQKRKFMVIHSHNK